MKQITPEQLAKVFHDVYERLAPQFGYETREESRVPWDHLPKANKQLMIAVAEVVLVSFNEREATDDALHQEDEPHDRQLA
jgi:hypothetical protein